MKIIICGDRDWSNYPSILNVVKRLKGKYCDIAIIQGEARGADTLAKRAALECGLKVIGYPAEWNKYGSSPGPRRNQRMLQEKPHMVIAFNKGHGKQV